MIQEKVNYSSLNSEYTDPTSLSYKKLRIINAFIPDGGSLLDIGMGTGELISLRLGKHKKIFGIDCDDTSVSMCRKKFSQNPEILLSKAGISDIRTTFPEKFDCITCLDVLEHIEEREVSSSLSDIFMALRKNGILIFSGPGVVEKIRIFLGKSPTHLHSHSSHGWKKIIEKAGFTVICVETVEFPLIRSDFLRKKMHIFGKCCVIVAKKTTDG
jgi:2-polyprenyl-3-methyl-5-hydroxy-6-metoxy-1,4-benzoquinol methylase